MLTKKQEKFVEGLIEGKTQREAYKAAYNTARMHDNTIDARASELFRNGEVTVRYRELMQKAVEKTEYESTEVRKDIIIQLMSILRADVKDYYTFTHPKRGASKAKLKDLTDLDTKPIKGITTDRQGNNHVALYDKITAIHELIDIFGLVENKSKEGESIQINVPLEYLQ